MKMILAGRPTLVVIKCIKELCKMKPAVQCLVITLLLAQYAYSQQKQAVSLQQAIQVALEKNVAVIQSQANVNTAQGRVLATYGNYLPTLSAFGSWSRSQVDRQAGVQIVGGQNIPFGASFSVANSFSTGLSLGYTLFDGFNREAGFNSAKAGAQSSEDNALRTRQSITNQVETSYMNVLRLNQLVKVSEENLKRDRQQLDRITESNKVGAVALADVYRQQSQVAADELQQITNQNNYDKAKAQLADMVGLDVADEYDFTDPNIPTTIDQAELDSSRQRYPDVNALNKRALVARQDYMAAKEDLSSAESGVTQARSGYWPSVSASLGYTLYNDEFSKISNNKTVDWGVRIQWNLFDAFRTNLNMQQAISTKQTREATLAQTERDIMMQLKQATLDFEAAGKQVEVSQKGLVSANEDYKIAQERYNLGAGTLLDLLTANAGLVNAEANNVNAVYNYNIAKRTLEFTIGEQTY